MAIGFIVIGGIVCAASGGGASGGVFNPALGTAIVAVNNWFLGKSAANIWIFIVGPFVGSVIGAGVFTLLHFHRDPMLEYDAFEQPSFY
jgi:glycerol uptake facilitator-like aquaporin